MMPSLPVRSGVDVIFLSCFLVFALAVPVRIWSEIWRFICDARGLCMNCLIFLGVFHVGCTGLIFFLFIFWGWRYGKLAHCDFYLILDAFFFTTYLYMEMGGEPRLKTDVYLDLTHFHRFHFFSFFPSWERFGYNAVVRRARFTGVCLLIILNGFWVWSGLSELAMHFIKGKLCPYVYLWISITIFISWLLGACPTKAP